MHLPFDIHGYHYPLLDYAFRRLSQGRIPEWDPAMYCGIRGRPRLPFKAVELMMFLHVWLGFVLAWRWLRGREMEWFPAAAGAAVFAFGGYTVSQLNHVGVICGYMWTPLALGGIDGWTGRREWRGLGRVAIAASLCFLAGCPPSWVAFCVTCAVYALAGAAGGRAAAGTVAALVFSLGLSAVQLLPAWELAQLKTLEPKYGNGMRGLHFYASYLAPNYPDFGRNIIGAGDPPQIYLYLGLPALFALCWVLCRPREWSRHRQALAVAAAGLMLATNPCGLVWDVVSRSRLLSQACQAVNFLECIPVAAALLAGQAMSDFLRRRAPRTAWWAAAALLLFGLALFALRGAAGRWRACILTALLVMIWSDYKVYGTWRRFSADDGDVDRMFPVGMQIGMSVDAFRELKAHPTFRVALDDTGPDPAEMRQVDAFRFGPTATFLWTRPTTRCCGFWGFATSSPPSRAPPTPCWRAPPRGLDAWPAPVTCTCSSTGTPGRPTGGRRRKARPGWFCGSPNIAALWRTRRSGDSWRWWRTCCPDGGLPSTDGGLRSIVGRGPSRRFGSAPASTAWISSTARRRFAPAPW